MFYGIINVDGSFILFPFLKFIYFIFIHSALNMYKEEEAMTRKQLKPKSNKYYSRSGVRIQTSVPFD